ncbi:hypothetical protein AURDEDRAFT_124092 [Auricularia subglabra TFB-10046 SS5]|nr:hypothetical protein AURDEDRAFT_124092 [Auricularia subglabra TFB-10046 SS5]
MSSSNRSQQQGTQQPQQQAAGSGSQQGQAPRASVPVGMAHLLNPAQTSAGQARPGQAAQAQQTLIYPRTPARGMGTTPPPIDPSSTALLEEIFGRSGGSATPAPAVHRPARAPVLARDYMSRPSPVAWRKGQFLVDFQQTAERRADLRRWICPCCDVKDPDANVVMTHYAASHADRRRAEDPTQLLRYFLVE